MPSARFYSTGPRSRGYFFFGCYHFLVLLFQVSIQKSLYAIQLEDWITVFPRNQIHIIKAEDFYANATKELHATFRFLDLSMLE